MIRMLFLAWYFFGLVLMLFFEVPESLRAANALFLCLLGIYACKLLYETGIDRQRVLLSFALILAGGYASEWLGITTGFPFGSYHYSDVLGLSLFGVPVAMSMAWAGVMITCLLLADTSSIWHRAWQTGLACVLLDLVLDPVAVRLGLWTWHQPGAWFGIPYTNFLGWFGVSYVLSLLLPHPLKLQPRVKQQALRLYQLLHLFFGLLAWKYGLWELVLLALVISIGTEGRARYARSPQELLV